jgi:DinB superfamily
MDKEEIIQESRGVFKQFADVCLAIPDKKFFFQPQEKWSIAQNVDHLIRSIKATQLAYSLPKFLVRILFGRPNRSSRSYNDLVAKYRLKLEQGGRATGRFIPKKTFANKSRLVQQLQMKNEKYLHSLEQKWNDLQLDQYIALHPLLGKITLRELCYFTIYHTRHHLNIINTRLAEQLN